MPLAHLASRIIGTPLLIARPKLEVILSVLGSRLGLPSLGLPDLDMALPALRQAAPNPAGIAIIPVVGTLVRRSMGLEAASGLLSYGEVQERLDSALADPQVAGILLDLDSPGGEASGVFELAERIRAACQIKPIWAHANDAAYSAAFAIAAACQRLTLSQTAGVGSIGVIALHLDQSVKDAKDGLNYTAIFAGSHKNDLSPHEPLSPQASSQLQTEVNRLYELFVAQVAQMRGLDPQAVRDTEAGVFYGEQAVVAGLADAVMPLEQVISEFTETLASRKLTKPRSSLPNTRSFTLENSMSEPQEYADGLDTLPLEQSLPSGDSPPDPSALAQSFANGLGQAQAIAELCLIAGQSLRTAEFLASGLSEAQVRRVLLDDRANQTDISSFLSIEAGTRQTCANSEHPENSPVVNAVKKLTAKE